MRIRRVAAVLGVSLLLLGASLGASGFLDATAREALSNRTFSRVHSVTPGDLGLAHRDVTLQVDDIALAAWWIPGHGSNATTSVVLVHGHSANMSKLLRQHAPMLHEAGYSLFLLDLRNHGASGDGPDGYVTYGTTEQRDVLAAVRHVRENASTYGVDANRIVLYGQSMGAATAILTAAAETIHAVVADSSYASFRDQAHRDGQTRGYPRFVVDWVVDRMDRFAPEPPSHADVLEVIADVQAPVLLAHCRNDARLSAESLDNLRARRPDARVWDQVCPHGDSPDHHVDGWATPGYNATVLDFLARA